MPLAHRYVAALASWMSSHRYCSQLQSPFLGWELVPLLTLTLKASVDLDVLKDYDR